MKLIYRQLLSRPERNGPCPVVLDVAWDGQRAKLATGVSCRPTPAPRPGRWSCATADSVWLRMGNVPA